MIKAAASIGAAAILTAFVSMVPAPRVEAGTPVASSAGEGRTAGCAQRAWPYSQHGCLSEFEARWHGEPRKVRLVTTDRLN
jgi:hypothetical protein